MRALLASTGFNLTRPRCLFDIAGQKNNSLLLPASGAWGKNKLQSCAPSVCLYALEYGGSIYGGYLR